MTSPFTMQDVEDEENLAMTFAGLGERLVGKKGAALAGGFAEMAVRCAERAKKIKALLREPGKENSDG